MIDIFHTWVDKIKSNDAHQVSELYHQDGILLGTFSNIERVGRSLIFDYFEDLLKSPIDVQIISEKAYKTKSMSTVAGLYNFIVSGEKIEARFSFVFLKTSNKWEIISHHSSILPK